MHKATKLACNPSLHFSLLSRSCIYWYIMPSPQLHSISKWRTHKSHEIHHSSIFISCSFTVFHKINTISFPYRIDNSGPSGQFQALSISAYDLKSYFIVLSMYSVFICSLSLVYILEILASLL